MNDTSCQWHWEKAMLVLLKKIYSVELVLMFAANILMENKMLT